MFQLRDPVLHMTHVESQVESASRGVTTRKILFQRKSTTPTESYRAFLGAEPAPVDAQHLGGLEGIQHRRGASLATAASDAGGRNWEGGGTRFGVPASPKKGSVSSKLGGLLSISP